MTPDAVVVSVLLERDQAIDRAVSERDGAVLEEAFADDYVYAHSHGKMQNKREYIDGVTSRADPPRRCLSEVTVEVHHDIAVTSGSMDVVYSDERPTLYMRYARVWRKVGAEWLVVSHRTFYAHDRDPDRRIGR